MIDVDIDILNNIAIQAGEKILEFYQADKPAEVDWKSDDSPLTKADLASHDVIVKGLKENYPDIPIISEESAIPSYEERKNWKEYFLIDPLDGTKEFIKRNGEFTVNIALMRNNEPVMGVVYIPAQEVLYYGVQGEGSFKKVEDQQAERIEHEPFDKSKS